jgi:hypothetical protein
MGVGYGDVAYQSGFRRLGYKSKLVNGINSDNDDAASCTFALTNTELDFTGIGIANNSTSTEYFTTTSGANAYTGGTTISAGTLELDNADAAGSGSITFESGNVAARHRHRRRHGDCGGGHQCDEPGRSVHLQFAAADRHFGVAQCRPIGHHRHRDGDQFHRHHGCEVRHHGGDFIHRQQRHATSITATSPAGTGTVDVTVTTPGGTSATGSAQSHDCDDNRACFVAESEQLRPGGDILRQSARLTSWFTSIILTNIHHNPQIGHQIREKRPLSEEPPRQSAAAVNSCGS